MCNIKLNEIINNLKKIAGKMTDLKFNHDFEFVTDDIYSILEGYKSGNLSAIIENCYKKVIFDLANNIQSMNNSENLKDEYYSLYIEYVSNLYNLKMKL